MAEKLRRIPTEELNERSFEGLASLLLAVEDSIEMELSPEDLKTRIRKIVEIGCGMDLAITKILQNFFEVLSQAQSMADKLEDKTLYRYLRNHIESFREGGDEEKNPA